HARRVAGGAAARTRRAAGAGRRAGAAVPDRGLRYRRQRVGILQRAGSRAWPRRGQTRAAVRRHAPHARARARARRAEGARSGSLPTAVDATQRWLPLESRHRARGRGRGLSHRRRHAPREGRHAALRRAAWLSGVAVKANFNSEDAFPASTHPDTLAALFATLKARRAGALTLAERSGMGDTRRVLERTGAADVAKKAGARVIVLDDVGRPAWEAF